MKTKKLIWELESTVYLLDEMFKKYKYVDHDVLKQSIAKHIGSTAMSVGCAILNMKYILTDGAEGLSAYTVKQEEAIRLTLEKYNITNKDLLRAL